MNVSSSVLGVSGSLRHASRNTELLRAAALLTLPGLRITLFEGLGGLPHFNPDLDTDPPPPAVRELRAGIAASDALLISSPEYAHGVPGVLKNALDWLVSDVAIVGKPIGLLNASPRAVHAPAALAEILRTMSADVVPGAQVTVPLLGQDLDAADIAADPELAIVVRGALTALVEAVQRRSSLLAPRRCEYPSESSYVRRRTSQYGLNDATCSRSPPHQDQEARRDRDDAHDRFKAREAEVDERLEPVDDQPDSQQEHAEVLCELHEVEPPLE